MISSGKIQIIHLPFLEYFVCLFGWLVIVVVLRCIYFILKILFIYLFIYLTDGDHKQAERQAERERKAGSLLSREPDASQDSGTMT